MIIISIVIIVLWYCVIVLLLFMKCICKLQFFDKLCSWIHVHFRLILNFRPLQNPPLLIVKDTYFLFQRGWMFFDCGISI